MESSPSKLRTVKEAAAFLSLSTAMIYALCDAGKLAYFNFGIKGRRSIRFTQEALTAYRDSCLIETAAARQIPPAPRQKRAVRSSYGLDCLVGFEPKAWRK